MERLKEEKKKQTDLHQTMRKMQDEYKVKLELKLAEMKEQLSSSSRNMESVQDFGKEMFLKMKGGLMKLKSASNEIEYHKKQNKMLEKRLGEYQKISGLSEAVLTPRPNLKQILVNEDISMPNFKDEDYSSTEDRVRKILNVMNTRINIKNQKKKAAKRLGTITEDRKSERMESGIMDNYSLLDLENV